LPPEGAETPGSSTNPPVETPNLSLSINGFDFPLHHPFLLKRAPGTDSPDPFKCLRNIPARMWCLGIRSESGLVLRLGTFNFVFLFVVCMQKYSLHLTIHCAVIA
jgi:hypothetical protein